MNSGKSEVDVEPIKHHTSVFMIVPGGAAKRPCVLLAVLGRGSGLPMVGDKILRRMQDT